MCYGPLQGRGFRLATELTPRRPGPAWSIPGLWRRSHPGDNTDGAVLVRTWRSTRAFPSRALILLLGAGALSREPGVLPLAALARLVIANRTRAKAEALARDFAGTWARQRWRFPTILQAKALTPRH